jgi:16S rRNA (cytosine967-C5)-methyltransferase
MVPHASLCRLEGSPAVRELVYRAIRACGPVPAGGRAAMLRLAAEDAAIAPLFDGSAYGPASIEPGEPVADGGVAPAWLTERLAGSGVDGAEAAALLDRAPLDVRVNALRTDRGGLALPVAGEQLPTPQGLRLPFGTQVEQWAEYRDGLIEVQDCGSQLACEAVAARPGETVIDLCAGAGGKTLALAAAMGGQGILIAADTDRGRLSRLAPRAGRAGALVSETVLLDPGARDRSARRLARHGRRGAGRCAVLGQRHLARNPEARWRLDEAGLAQVVALQRHVLAIRRAAGPAGGRLVYVTCSLLDEEGPGQVEAFLADHAEWRATPPVLPHGRARGRDCA